MIIITYILSGSLVRFRLIKILVLFVVFCRYISLSRTFIEVLQKQYSFQLQCLTTLSSNTFDFPFGFNTNNFIFIFSVLEISDFSVIYKIQFSSVILIFDLVGIAKLGTG